MNKDVLAQLRVQEGYTKFDDRQLVVWCANALLLQKHPHFPDKYLFEYRGQMYTFDPLHDDAHVTALIKFFQPLLGYSERDGVWRVLIGINDSMVVAWDADYNRAVVKCAAEYYYNICIAKWSDESQKQAQEERTRWPFPTRPAENQA